MRRRLSDIVGSALRFIKDHKRWFIALAALLAAVFIYLIFVGISYRLSHRNDPVKLGVSYSTKYAAELDINYREGFSALIDDMGVENFRLMSYWDLHEPENNQYKWDRLDWYFEEAEAKGVSISLATGQRQPRWPECHIPDWTRQLDDEQYTMELLEYLETVANRYKDSPALKEYQLENEWANNLFGECPIKDRDRLTSEYSSLKQADPERDVVINVSNQSGIPVIGPIGDRVGFSIYRDAYTEVLGKPLRWSFWYVPSFWHSIRAGLIERFHGRETFIHELQTEPWGPDITANLTLEQQNETMNAEKIPFMVDYAKSTGMKEIYLWGGEWWYWRLTEFDDRELWDSVKQVFAENN